MKKLFFTFGLLFLGLVATTAQEVGNIWVGGNVGFTSSKKKGEPRNVDYKIVPEVGYILNERFAIGIRGGYEHYDAIEIERTATSVIMNEANGYSISPFVRYTFLKGDIGGLFLDGSVGYGQLKLKGVEDKINKLEVGISPGVAISLSEKVAVVGKFGFLGYSQTQQGDDDKETTFGLNLDMSKFEFGINYIF